MKKSDWTCYQINSAIQDMYMYTDLDLEIITDVKRDILGELTNR